MNDHFIIPIVHGPDESAPSMLPDVFGWGELAAPAHPAPWGLYRCLRDLDLPVPPTWIPIPAPLSTALRSGYAYPPSLALMRELLPAYLAVVPLSLDAFVTTATTLLRASQAHHVRHRFCLAESHADHLGYLTPGIFYWITGYYPSHDIVQWVSEDYILYYAARSAFHIDQATLAHLHWSPDREWMLPIDRIV